MTRAELQEVTDILLREGEGVALVEERLIWLSPLAALLVDRLQTGVKTLSELCSAARDEFGQPPATQDIETVVRSALRTLETEGLVRTA